MVGIKLMNTNYLHINDYISNLLENRHFRNAEYQKLIENSYLLHNVTGNISPGTLCKLIKRAKWNKKYRDVLIAVLYHVDQDSVTNYNFNLLTKFRKHRRNTFLSIIAHANLSFYQMSAINRICGEYEAFSWLFDKICSAEMFSETDMLTLLQENKAVTSYGIQSCIEAALIRYGNIKKIDIAMEWMASVGSTGDGTAY